jgi:hypothetical protein
VVTELVDVIQPAHRAGCPSRIPVRIDLLDYFSLSQRLADQHYKRGLLILVKEMIMMMEIIKIRSDCFEPVWYGFPQPRYRSSVHTLVNWRDGSN